MVTSKHDTCCTRVVCLVYQQASKPRDEDGPMVMKVLKDEPYDSQDDPQAVAKMVLDNEVKASLHLEMAGVQGTVRMKYYTYNLGNHEGNNNAIFMSDAGT